MHAKIHEEEIEFHLPVKGCAGAHKKPIQREISVTLNKFCVDSVVIPPEDEPRPQMKFILRQIPQVKEYRHKKPFFEVSLF